jgi:hypothetical protein
MSIHRSADFLVRDARVDKKVHAPLNELEWLQ